MANVFVVIGSTGDYSDHKEWPVRAFLEEQHAQDFVSLLAAEDRVLQLRIKAGTPRWECEHPSDPGWATDYTGTNYAYWTVPL